MWGNVANSRLGGVDVRRHHTPQPVKTLVSALQRLRVKLACAPPPKGNSIVSCGLAHTLVLTTTGQLLAWGCGTHGQLGYGDLWDREDPVVVPTVRSVIAFAAGDRHTIAVSQGLQRATFGRLRFLSSIPNSNSCQVQGIEPISLQTRKNHVSNLTLDAHRLVYVWGLNAFGELGLGNISYMSPRMAVFLQDIVRVGDENIRLQPARLHALGTLNALSCAAGSRHTIIISADANQNNRNQPLNNYKIKFLTLFLFVGINIWTPNRKMGLNNLMHSEEKLRRWNNLSNILSSTINLHNPNQPSGTVSIRHRLSVIGV